MTTATEPTVIRVKRRRPHPGQERLAASPARFRVAMFGRRWGKNVAGIDEAQVAALNGKRVGWFEPTFKYLLEAWRELVNRLQPVTRHLSEQDKRLELLTGGVIECWSADNPDAGRGREYDLVVVNEAGIIRNLLQLWQQSLWATLVKTRGRALFMGTPKGRTHDFSMLFAKAETEPDWEAFRGPTSENPFIPADEIEAARRDLPAQVFAQEFEGVPADDGGNPFGLDAIAACTSPQPLDGEVVAWGWDFARAQDWTVGVGLDKDYRAVRVERWQMVPWPETKARIAKYTGDCQASGDSTGVGDPIVQDLQATGVRIDGVSFTGSLRHHHTGAITAGTKQKLMERLVLAIQTRTVTIPDGPVRAELETFGYEYTANGVRYSAPEGFHDDCVMALALAVHCRDRVGAIWSPLPEFVKQQDIHEGFERKYRRVLEAAGHLPPSGPQHARYKPKRMVKL